MDRREFLNTSAAAAAAMSVPLPFATPRRRRAGEELRFGVVGTGSRGGDHIRALQRVEGARVTAVCDNYPPHLENGLRRAGGEEAGVQAFLDHREMLDAAELDAVIVASPIHTHAEITIDSLEAGRHVLVEKSMAHTIPQGQAMVEAVRRTGKLLQVGLQRRYTSYYQVAKDLIDAGKIGQLTHATLHWHRNASWRRPVPAPHGEWTAERLEHQINHRMYWATSGGLMAELGSHLIDIVNWMLDEVPSAVVGIGGIDSWKDGREVQDNVNVVFEYPSGCKATFTSIQSNAFDGGGIKLLGPKGTILLEPKAQFFPENKEEELWSGAPEVEKDGRKGLDFTSGATQSRDAGHEGEGQKLERTPQMLDGSTAQLVEFANCIRTGRRPFCDEVEGYRDSVCVVLANQAMLERRFIEVSPDLWSCLD